MRFALKNNQIGANEIELSGSNIGTVDSGWEPAPGDAYRLFKNHTTIFSEYDLDDMGFIEATSKSLVDCEDTATALIDLFFPMMGMQDGGAFDGPIIDSIYEDGGIIDTIY